MLEVPIFFVVFRGKIFDSPGISEILLNLHTLHNTGFWKQSAICTSPNKTEHSKHVIYALCLHWASSFNIDYYNLVSKKFFDLGHFSFNKNKTQTAVTNICLNCIRPGLNVAFYMHRIKY